MHVSCIFVFAPVQRNWACFTWKGALEIRSILLLLLLLCSLCVSELFSSAVPVAILVSHFVIKISLSVILIIVLTCLYWTPIWTPFTRQGCFSAELAHFFLFHLCLSFCLLESFSCAPFYPTTSLTISAVFSLRLPLLSLPAIHLYFSFFYIFFKLSFCHSSFSLWSTTDMACWVSATTFVLEDRIHLIQVTVGLRHLSANTSLWPKLQLGGRWRKPCLISWLVAPLL